MRSMLLRTVISTMFGFCVSATNVLAEKQQTKVGVIVAQSGPIAAIGKGVMNGIILAGEQRDPNHHIQFIFEDDSAQAAKALSSARKLIDSDRVSALVTFTGGSSAAVAPLAESKGIPLITIAAGDKHTIGKKFVYRLYLSTDAQVDLILEEMQRRNLHTIGVFTTTQESLVRLKDILLEKAKERVVANEEIAPSDTDIQTLVSKVNSRKPDAVVFYLLPPQLAVIAKSLRDQGYRGDYFGAMTVYNYAEVKASGGALVGTVFPAPRSSEALREFERSYIARFREPIASGQEIYGYDIASVAIEAAEKGSLQDFLVDRKSISGLAGEYPRRVDNFFEVASTVRQLGPEAPMDIGKP